MLKLIKYEFRKNLGLLIAMLCSIGALEAYFLISLSLEEETHLIISGWLLMMASGLAALLVFILAISSYSRELSQKSSYLIFMTPHSTLAIVASKMLYTVVLGVGLTFFLGALVALDMPLLMGYLDEWQGFLELMDELLHTQNLSIAGILFTGLFFMLLIFCQVLAQVGLAYLAITLSSTLLQNRKGKAFVSVLFFLVLAWAVSKLSNLWSDDMYLANMQLDTLSDAVRACLPWLLQAVAVLLVSLFGSAWLLERYVSL